MAQTGVADEETRLVVVAAMSRLPKRQREAIALRDLADLSPPAVAASLGISVNSVKRHLQRGLATLRNDLSDEED